MIDRCGRCDKCNRYDGYNGYNNLWIDRHDGWEKCVCVCVFACSVSKQSQVVRTRESSDARFTATDTADVAKSSWMAASPLRPWLKKKMSQFAFYSKFTQQKKRTTQSEGRYSTHVDFVLAFLDVTPSFGRPPSFIFCQQGRQLKRDRPPQLLRLVDGVVSVAVDDGLHRRLPATHTEHNHKDEPAGGPNTHQ